MKRSWLGKAIRVGGAAVLVAGLVVMMGPPMPVAGLVPAADAETLERDGVRGNPSFRSACLPLPVTTDDMMFPPGDHQHVPSGNTAMTKDSTPQSLAENPETTCDRRTQNNSYWTMVVAQRNPNTGEVLRGKVTRHGVYEKVELGLDNTKTIPTPFGMKAVARDYGGTGEVEWHCGWRNHKAASGRVPRDCPRGELGMQVTFPECWDGKRLLSGAWSLVEAVKKADGTKACPGHHPKQIPTTVLNYDIKLPVEGYGRVFVAGHDGAWVGPDYAHANKVQVEDTDEIHERCITPPKGEKRPASCKVIDV